MPNHGKVDISVSCSFDPEAKVWIATSNDINLALEDSSLDRLFERIPIVIVDLIEDGGLKGLTESPVVTLSAHNGPIPLPINGGLHART